MIRREVVGHFGAAELSAMVDQIQGAPTIRKGPQRIQGPDYMVGDQPIEFFDLKLIAMSEECWYDVSKDRNRERYGLYLYNDKGPATFQGFTVAVIQSIYQQKEKWVQFHE